MDTILSNADLQHAGVELRSPLRLPGEADPHMDPEPLTAENPTFARVPLGAASETRRRNLFTRKTTANGAPAHATRATPTTIQPEGNIQARPRARRSGRGVLLATVAVVGIMGSAAWIYRGPLGTVSLQHLNLSDMSLALADAVQQARGAGQFVAARVESVGRMAAGPSSAPTAAPMRSTVASSAIPPADPHAVSQPLTKPPGASTEATSRSVTASLADFASLQASPGAAASAPAEVGVAPRAAASPGVASQPAQPVATPPPAVSQPAPSPPAPSATVAALAVQGAPAPPTPIRPAPAPAPLPSAVSPPAAAPSVADGERSTAAQASVGDIQPALTTASSTAVLPSSHDPAVIAAALTAAPLSKPDQVKVVGLVHELGAQLRGTRTQLTELQATVAQLSKQVATSNADFESRLDLSETATVLAESAKAGAPPAADGATPAAPPPATRPATFRVPAKRATIPAPPPAAPSDRRTVKDYVVKGASPGLAALAALNPQLGESGVVEVGVGDPVPGLGRVKAIYQRGTTWVVQTENGAIQQ